MGQECSIETDSCSSMQCLLAEIFVCFYFFVLFLTFMLQHLGIKPKVLTHVGKSSYSLTFFWYIIVSNHKIWLWSCSVLVCWTVLECSVFRLCLLSGFCSLTRLSSLQTDISDATGVHMHLSSSLQFSCSTLLRFC